MKEITLNLHIHSTLSDGHASYNQIAQFAGACGVNVLIITDHNVFPIGLEGYYDTPGGRVLVLTGEEIHDQTRIDQKNHLLAFNTHQDLSQLGDRTQVLIDRINQIGGLAFIAHPVEHELKAFGEPDISWVDWSVHGITGIELWNGLSEIKNVSHNTLQAAFHALFPAYLAHNPLPETLAIWDDHLKEDKRLVAVGGADAHCLPFKLGPFTRPVLPYEYHFKAINNHLLLPTGLTGKLEQDKKAIYQALKYGNSYVGYDLPHSTQGFRFNAQGTTGTVSMGEEIPVQGGVTFQIHTPAQAKILLIRNGSVVQRWKGAQVGTYTTHEPGAYRVEAWIQFLGRRRGWIFSNPIYVRA